MAKGKKKISVNKRLASLTDHAALVDQAIQQLAVATQRMEAYVFSLVRLLMDDESITLDELSAWMSELTKHPRLESFWAAELSEEAEENPLDIPGNPDTPEEEGGEEEEIEDTPQE
jgi:hypothetical protein